MQGDNQNAMGKEGKYLVDEINVCTIVVTVVLVLLNSG